MSLVTNLDNIYKNGVIGNVRKAQEDSHGMELKTPNGDVFVVCDGMGGHVGGAKASSIAVDSILSHLKKEQYANPIEALNGALQFANMQILGYASQHPELQGMGTTACIVLMQGNDVWIAHVGDSRIYLYLGKEKELHRITKDHSFVQTLVDAGQITDEEAEHHPQKNRILKALGIKPELQPTFNYNNQPIHPKNGDIFLICSDGLSGMIPDSTIEQGLRQNMTIAEKGNLLIQLAMQGETVVPGGQDNCTAELIQIDNSPWQKSEFKSYNPPRASRPVPAMNEPAPAYIPSNGDNDKKKGGKKKLIIIAIVVLLVLGAGGFGIYKVMNGKGDVNNVETVDDKSNNENKDGNNVNDVDKVINEYDKFVSKKQEILTSKDTAVINNAIGEGKKVIEAIENLVEKDKKDFEKNRPGAKKEIETYLNKYERNLNSYSKKEDK